MHSWPHTYIYVRHRKDNTSKSSTDVDVYCFTRLRFHAGTLMGITNAVATIPGFVGPSVVGALTYKNVSFTRFDNV